MGLLLACHVLLSVLFVEVFDVDQYITSWIAIGLVNAQICVLAIWGVVGTERFLVRVLGLAGGVIWLFVFVSLLTSWTARTAVELIVPTCTVWLTMYAMRHRESIKSIITKRVLSVRYALYEIGILIAIIAVVLQIGSFVVAERVTFNRIVWQCMTLTVASNLICRSVFGRSTWIWRILSVVVVAMWDYGATILIWRGNPESSFDGVLALGVSRAAILLISVWLLKMSGDRFSFSTLEPG
jgi:hypothetical protein